MLKIRKTDISLTRGDSAYIELTISNGTGEPLELAETDVVRCQVRDFPTTGSLAFEGVITREGENIIWHISPNDTASLTPGTYYWDAQVEFTESGDIFTFIPVSRFIVLDEITEGQA